MDTGLHGAGCHPVCAGGRDLMFTNGQPDGQLFPLPKISINGTCPDDILGEVTGYRQGHPFKQYGKVRRIKILTVPGCSDEHLCRIILFYLNLFG